MIYLVTPQNINRALKNRYSEGLKVFEAYVIDAAGPRNAVTAALGVPNFGDYARVLSVYELGHLKAQFRPTVKQWDPMNQVEIEYEERRNAMRPVAKQLRLED